MKSKEALIIQRLVKIANNQQEILKRLAQANEDKDYLVRVAQTAAANTAGFTASNFTVTYQGGSQTPPNSDGTTAKIEGGWTVSLSGAPKDNKLRQKYIDTFRTQVANQRPDLEPISIVFAD
jgi:hypothetical protein